MQRWRTTRGFLMAALFLLWPAAFPYAVQATAAGYISCGTHSRYFGGGQQ
jgi:hypothetical protein